MPTTTPSYCNPFFPRCKHFFQFFENNFDGSQGKKDNFANYFPKSGKYAPRHPAGKAAPSQPAHYHGSKVGNPEFSPADCKGMDQPGPHHCCQKHTVRQHRKPRPQRTQKLITQAQQRPDDQGRGEPLGSQFRRGHPSSRRSRDPPCFCCS